MFLDAIHFHVRSEGQITKKAVYIAISIDLDGKYPKIAQSYRSNLSIYFKYPE